MVTQRENVFYYLTVMNENYAHPGLRAGDEAGIEWSLGEHGG